LDFHRELAKERRLKNGGRSATFSVPLGTTLIVQLSSSPTTSTICPLAAALAAGNSAIVIGSPGLSSTNELVEQILLEALDHESFHLEKISNVQDCEAYTQEKYASVVINGLEASQIIGSTARAANPSVNLREPYYGVPAGIIGRSGGHHVDTIVKQIQESALGIQSHNIYRRFKQSY
jgi:acyl-CoA reductase-like NAD-dependent aldehyde dehydrogenase